MELWIRSQDKEKLMRVKEVLYQYGAFEDNTLNVIIGSPFYDDNAILGEYKTKERALEVLDEIQSILRPTINFSPIINEDKRPEYIYKHYECKGYESTIEQLDTYVYEMPKN